MSRTGPELFDASARGALRMRPRLGALAALALASAACSSGDRLEPAFAAAAAPSAPAPSRAAATPLAAASPRDSQVVGDAELAGWAQRSGQQAAGVRLEQVALYGAGGVAEGSSAAREVRVVLRFDGVAVYRRGELPAEGGLPRRLVLDLDGVAIGHGVQPVLPVGGGGLARIRAFVLDRDRVRVSFDVGPDTAYRLFFLSDPFRVVMDFRNELSVQQSAARPWTVVLDAGHGGEQPGATGPNGLHESQVALALARRVRQALRRHAPRCRVLMTRDEDRFVSLEERAAIANAVDADLFVSIHLNASPAEDQGGIATFVLDATDDQAALRLAARENDTDLEGVSKLQPILASLYRRDQAQHSHQLAEDVHRHLLHGGRRLLPELNDRGVKSALFYVLVGAQMPAILVEASFITRPREAAALLTDEYRQALADGIAEGIVRYLER